MRTLVTILFWGTALFAHDIPATALWDVMPADFTPTARQAQQLERIKAQPSTVDLVVVRLNPQALADLKVPLSLELPGKVNLEIRDYALAPQGPYRAFTWRGKELTEDAILTLDQHYAVGLIHHDRKVYSVEALGDGMEAVVEIDQRHFPRD